MILIPVTYSVYIISESDYSSCDNILSIYLINLKFIQRFIESNIMRSTTTYASAGNFGRVFIKS